MPKQMQTVSWKSMQVVVPDLPEISDDDLKLIQESIARAVDREFEKLFFTPPPVSDFIAEKPARSCNCLVIHTCGMSFA